MAYTQVPAAGGATSLRTPDLDALTGDIQLIAGTNITIEEDQINGTFTISNSGEDTGITELTGDVTAGPGSGSVVATIPPETVTAAMIDSEESTDGQVLTSQGDGTAAWEAVPAAVAAGETGDIQFNDADALAASEGQFTYTPATYILHNGTVDIHGMPEATAVIDLSGNAMGAYVSSQIGNDLNLTATASVNASVNGTVFTMLPNGTFRLPQVASDPMTPTEGDIWYNATSHTWRGYNGTALVTFDVTPD